MLSKPIRKLKRGDHFEIGASMENTEYMVVGPAKVTAPGQVLGVALSGSRVGHLRWFNRVHQVWPV